MLRSQPVRLRLGCREQVLDVLRDVAWQERLAVADDGHAFAVDEEFLEVPAHVGDLQTLVVEAILAGERLPRRRAVRLEICVERVFVRPVHVDLLRQLKVGLKTVSRSNVLERVEDLRSIIAWLLEGELVTGDTKDPEVLEAVLECIQGRVLGGRPSEGGHVYDQHHFTAVLCPVYWASQVDVPDGVIVYGLLSRSGIVTEDLVDFLLV